MLMLYRRLIYLFLCVSAMMYVSCGKDEIDVRMSDDPGYASAPLVSVQAKDGDRWIDGTIDQETRTVSFVFHSLEVLTSVEMRAVTDETWGAMISPASEEFTLNLTERQNLVVNDGVDDITYGIDASIYQLVESARATVNGETVSAQIVGSLISFKFTTVYLMSDLSSLDIDIELGEGAQIVSPSSFEGLDLSSGRMEIILKDTAVDEEKTYTLSVSTGDVITLPAGWEDVTAQYAGQYNLALSPEIKIYSTNSLDGTPGAYVLTIPAGMVDLKVVEKGMVTPNTNCKTSVILRENRDYSIFIPVQGPGEWSLDGDGAKTFYSSLAFGPDNGGTKKVLRADGFGDNRKKIYAPALAIKDGKAYISNASSDVAKNEFLRYSDVKGTDPQDWSDMDAAFGGYFQIVDNGASLVSSEGSQGYAVYNSSYRAITTLWQNFTKSWKLGPVTDHDALKTGRLAIGCTERGDLVIFMADKRVNTHNQGQGRDLGQDGALSDTRGVTLYQLAALMAGFGCSDAMTMEDYNWSYVTLQDNTDRGYDLVKTNSRWNLTSSDTNYDPTRKEESAELGNMFVVCIK